jgi:CTP synthase
MPTTAEHLGGYDAILVPGGFGERGVEGKIATARFARERKVPYLGICLGMQVATIEFARNVAGLADANSTEFKPDTPHPVIALIDRMARTRDGTHQEAATSTRDLGGTMRLGAQSSDVEAPEPWHIQIYGQRGHRAPPPPLRSQRALPGPASQQAGLVISAHDTARAADRDRRAAAARCTPGSSACSSTRSSSSTPWAGHPLFNAASSSRGPGPPRRAGASCLTGRRMRQRPERQA